MEQVGQGYFVPIVCRFVPNDQWLVTHLHTSWKISEVKLWLLAKCLPTLFTPAPAVPRQRLAQRRRPVSPITFANRDELSDDERPPADVAPHDHPPGFDPLADPDDPFFTDKYKYVPRPAASTHSSDIIPKANSTSTSSDPSQYILLLFSTGQILEHDRALDWCPIHPYELFELHSNPFLVKLPRGVPKLYIQAYFEAPAWVLRLVDDFGSGGRIGDRLVKASEGADFEKDRSLKKRRTKVLQWHERWVFIREAQFQLCKDRNDAVPLHTVPLSSMVSLRGADYIRDIRKSSHDLFPGAKSSFADTRVICVKFRYESPPAESYAWFRRGSRDAGGSEESRKNSGAGVESGNPDEESNTEENWTGDTTVFVLHMLDDIAYNNILRVLHRDSHSAPSSFFPASARPRSPRRRSYSPISFASISPGQSPLGSPEPALPPRTPSPSTPIPSAVRYPEWRYEITKKARRAGLGDVGRAMELAMKTAEAAAEGELMPSDHEDEGPASPPPRGRTLNKWGVHLDSDSDSSIEDSGSELEWEGWEADLFSSRARRSIMPSSSDVLEPTRRWNHKPDDDSPPSDYSFPPNDSAEASRKSLGVPHRTLSRYSSTDSMIKRRLQSAGVRSPAPLRASGRAESPMGGRYRPRSPLAGESADYEYFEPEPGLAVPMPQQLVPDVAYPSRRSSNESSLRTSSSGHGHNVQRNIVPMSMAMTTITSTVTAGPDPPQKKKGKGKPKVIEPPKQPRKRSLTVQGSPSMRPSMADSLRDSPNANLSVPDDHWGRGSSKTKLKLSMSFSHTAAEDGSPSTSTAKTLAPPPLSATSASSFESPRFAHPEDSD